MVLSRRFPIDRVLFTLGALLMLAGPLHAASGAGGVGALAVESDPSGASVYVDGQFAGRTPLALASLPTGDHRVHLVSDGYLENSRIVTVTGGKTVILQSRLTPALQRAQAAGLKIVVIDGEDAVNVVQQKTAVAPVVEVRDRNDQPVAGAVVRFAIQSGRANFSGARTLTLTTNAVGRATVTGLTPTGSGALHISASAAFQGQTAAVTIAQTNVMTAAQATAATGAGGGGGAGAGAGGAAGGTGGGLSATTIGIVGGAAAGGTIALREVGLLGGSGVEYVGSFSGIFRHTPDSGGCFRDEQHTGEMRMHLEVSDTGTVTGSAELDATATVVTFTNGCAAPWGNQETYDCCDTHPEVGGTTASLGFHTSRPGAPGVTFTFEFTGALNGTEIVGTYTETIRQVPSGFGGSQRYPLTLTKQ